MPKAIVFIVDDDIVTQSNILRQEAKDGDYKLIVRYLFEEVDRILVAYEDKLPTKSKKQYYPHVLWILPPTHKYLPNNDMREFFNAAMEKQVSEFTRMCALHLKKVWDDKDGNLFLYEQRRFTPQGHSIYWSAIDAAVKFWDKTLQDILLKCQKKTVNATAPYYPRFIQKKQIIPNKYHWSRKQSPEMGHFKPKRSTSGHSSLHRYQRR